MTIELLNRLIDVESTTIFHPQFQHAIDVVERAFVMKRDFGLSRHLLCIGPSGIGKSTLKREIVARYESFEKNDRIIRPVLSIDTPSRPTVRSMAEALLIALDEPYYNRGTATEKTHRVFRLMEQKSVEMLVIDEFQHFIDRGRRNDVIEVTDWLKSVIDQTGISCVLIGLPRCEEILAYNEQLRRRFSIRLEMNPFSIANNSEIQTFASLISIFDKMLALPKRLTLTAGLTKSMFYATNGIIDYLRKLLCGAAEIAVSAGANQIEIHHLEQAFTDYVWHRGIGQLNPFNSKFSFNWLDKPGMPFHRSTGGSLQAFEISNDA